MKERISILVKKVINYINQNVDASVDENLISYVTDRNGHDRRYGIDPSKINAELGWLPDTDFESGIIKTIRWYLENTEWIEQIISGEYRNFSANSNQ